MELQDRWPLVDAASLRDELLAAYGGPDRRYHGLLHLREVLDRLDELAAHGVPFDPVTVSVAAWFHDAVHDASAGDEERSARWAEDALPPTGIPAEQVASVGRLVRLTERHDPDPADLDGAALCDADLAVLAAPRQRYRAYADGVRTEYGHVPDPLFRAGRSEVLRALLDRPHIFTTAAARRHWEPAARANVSRELQHLAAPPD